MKLIKHLIFPLTVIFLAGCGSDESVIVGPSEPPVVTPIPPVIPTPHPEAKLVSITVKPIANDNALLVDGTGYTIIAGSTQAYKIIAVYDRVTEDGSIETTTFDFTKHPGLVWNSSDTAAVINKDGIATADKTQAGLTEISASLGGKVSDPVILNVKRTTLVTWEYIGDYGANFEAVKDEIFDIKHVVSASDAYAAIKYDGTVITWGNKNTLLEGDPSTITNVKSISRTYSAFAAIDVNGKVTTWGNPKFGADSSSVADQLTDVESITGTAYAFAALKKDGSVVTWGGLGEFPTIASGPAGADYPAEYKDLKFKSIAAGDQAFAGITIEGKVVTWGTPDNPPFEIYGAEIPPTTAEKLAKVKVDKIVSTGTAFAALTTEGKVIAWGDSGHGGSPTMGHKPDNVVTTVEEKQLTDIKAISATTFAFAALKNDGSVITWGAIPHGGQDPKLKNIKSITGNYQAFAAITNDGKVKAWGNIAAGGVGPNAEGDVNESDKKTVESLKDVKSISSSSESFVAILEDNTAVPWGVGSTSGTGNPGVVITKQLINVTSVTGATYSVAAVKLEE